ncbi:MAG: ABC transporter ATP-binding protein [Crocinitomicaceae bacterium]|nr:ABC transporter ATP-binding protein [Crocinitomicaceae bacterium]
MKSLSYLNKYLILYKWRLLLGTLFICFSNYFGVEMPKIVKNAVNDFLNKIDHTVEFQSILILSVQLAGVYILFSLLKGFFLFLTRQTIIIVSRYIEFDLKNEIYTQYQRLNYSFYKKNNTGDLMNRISEDVSQVRQYLGPGLMYTINLAILSVMAIYTMMQINVNLTLIVLAPLPIMSVMIYRVSSKMNALSKFVQVEQSLLSTIVQETFSGIRVIKAYLREAEMQEKFDATSNAYKDKTMNQVRVNALFMPTIVFLIGLSTLLAIYYGGLLTYRKEITPGDIVAFIFYINMLTWPFASVGWVTSIIQRAAASQERINEFLKIVPAIQNPTETPLSKLDSIEFNHLSFGYENSVDKVLNDVSFRFKRGEKIGIIGKTGSGKTTLLNLLLRQLDPTEGELKVNGSNLKSINLNAYRKQIGVVPQEVFLFSDTIRNNIAFGVVDAEVTEDDLVRVAKQAHVLHNIEAFPDKFDTLLGERGVNLSGGQKQRVSIARALIRKPNMLVLDDCLSAVDTETEDVILKSIAEVSNDIITVIVSHRISSLRFVDRIYVLDEGRIKESGTHQELIQSKGLYAEMYEKQAKDKK